MDTVSRIFFAVLLFLGLTACSRTPEASGPEHQYQLVGKVVGLDVKHQTAMIAAGAIPNFMEAMTMEYPIRSKADFDTLHVGDNITATLNVNASGTGYNLTGIQKHNAGK